MKPRPRYVEAMIGDKPEVIIDLVPDAFVRLDAPFSAIRSGDVSVWDGMEYTTREVTCVTVEGVGYIVDCTRADFIDLIRGDIMPLKPRRSDA